MSLIFKKKAIDLTIWFFLFLASLIAAYYLFSNLFIFQNASAFPIADGILIYSTSTSAGLVHYRTYASSTNAFANPLSAITVPSDQVRFILSAGSPISNETIVGIEDDMGTSTLGMRLTILRWNGSSWINDWQTSSTASSTVGQYRRFGVAYYGNSGNAMVVFATSTSPSIAYKTWNGTSWSATSTFSMAAPTSGNKGTPQWVELAGHPKATSSSRLAIGYTTSERMIGYAIWNGTSWSVASTTQLLTMMARWRPFDVAIENTSGDAFLVYGQEARQGIQSVSCLSGCSSWVANAAGGTGITADAEFVDAAASPQAGSNDIAIVSCARQTPDDSAVGWMWTGAGYIAGAETDATSGCDVLSNQTTNFPAAVGWTGQDDLAFMIYPETVTAGALDFATCASGCTSFTLQTDASSLGCTAAASLSSVSITPWPNANQAMVTYIDNNAGVCQFIKRTDTTTWSTAGSGGTWWGKVKNLAGFAAGFSFFSANSAPNAPTQNSPTNGATDVSVTPTFLMTATDPSADKLGYKVTIYSESSCATVVQTNDQSVDATGWTGTDASCTNSPTSCYASGTQASFLTQTALSASTQYWWKASAKDPDGNGGFTDSSTCNNFTTIAASLTFTIDTPSVFIGSFTPGTPIASSTVLTVNTNNSTGYNITINRASTTPTLFFNDKTVSDIPNSNNWTAPSATTTAGPSAIWTDGATVGLGFRIKQTGTNSGAYHSAWWGADDASGNAKYSGISTSTAAQKISHQNLGSGSNENVTVNYRIDVSSNQSSGAYISSPVTYTATVNP